MKEINEMIQQNAKSFNTNTNVDLYRNPYTRGPQDVLKIVHEDSHEDFYGDDPSWQHHQNNTNQKNEIVEAFLSDAAKFGGNSEPVDRIIEEITEITKDIPKEGILEIEKLKHETNHLDKATTLDGKIVEHPNESDSDSEVVTKEKDAGGDNPKNSERGTNGQAEHKGVMPKSAGFEKLAAEMILNQSGVKRSILSQTMKEQPVI